MKYYKAIVKLGHIGRGKSREVPVYVKAENIYNAMMKAKRIPAVKHDQMPVKVMEITREEFIEGRKRDLYKQAIMDGLGVE